VRRLVGAATVRERGRLNRSLTVAAPTRRYTRANGALVVHGGGSAGHRANRAK